MKLIHAEFTNFRLLRDLVLDFSTDDAKNLTVIRAENESGKTTILIALQWALYGDLAIPGRSRRGYRLHPIDWDRAEGNRVPVVVEVDFELARIRRSSSQGPVSVKEKFRIIRSSSDTLTDDGWEPGPTSVNLFQITDTGATAIDPPEAFVKEELADELREIFFTDGDRALSFIEADVASSTKQARVRNAIRALLGLELIENARERVKRAASDVNRQVKEVASTAELTAIVDRLSELDERATQLHTQIEDADQQFTNFDERHADLNRRLEDALMQGNREELGRQLSNTRGQIERVNTQVHDTGNKHSELFRELSLVRDLASPALSKAFTKLNDLRDEGKIPNNTIPVLEERLTSATCICGEPLQGEDPTVRRRRNYLTKLLDGSREADRLQSVITDLYYGSIALQLGGTSSNMLWLTLIEETTTRRDQLDTLRRELGEQSKAIEAKIAQIPDMDIQGLRETRRQYAEQRDRFNASRSRYRADLANVQQEINTASRTREQMLRRQERGQRIMAHLEVAQDIEAVLRRAYERLTTDELNKVSARMNGLFLKMIGADPEQGALIQGASITPNFEIIAVGPENKILNPDRDLNGASRRALTLSFILALTNVSEVQAPNVVDTPLGMMSGYVKRASLTTAIQESSQLILFLTRSEISECEDILDTAAGRIVTLTNPAHYPIMLANDPEIIERSILKCSCGHRQDCDLCRRVDNA